MEINPESRGAMLPGTHDLFPPDDNHQLHVSPVTPHMRSMNFPNLWRDGGYPLSWESRVPHPPQGVDPLSSQALRNADTFLPDRVVCEASLL